METLARWSIGRPEKGRTKVLPNSGSPIWIRFDPSTLKGKRRLTNKRCSNYDLYQNITVYLKNTQALTVTVGFFAQMDALGWLKIGAVGYAVRFQSGEDNYVMYLTDMASLWCQQQTAVEIMKQCQDLNPLIESTVKGLITQLCTMLSSNPGNHNLHVNPNNQTAILKIESRLESNLPFLWEFELTRENDDRFRSFVILPLLAMLSEAASIEDELCNIIRSKDKQIDDYKASGASVSRRHLETKEFNAEAFFAARPSRTIDESVKEDITGLFCRVVIRLKQLYSAIFKRIVSQNSAPVPDEPPEPTKPISDETLRQPTPKETEASRAEAIRKRLREEELNEMAKSAKKAKIKRIL